MSIQPNNTYDVFISYNHVNTQWVWETLLPRLENAGLRVCIDSRDFAIGIPSLINMERAVDNSRHILLVLTPAWVDSQWTDFESLLAGTTDPAGYRRKLFPLLLEDCLPPARITILTYADFRISEEHDAQFSRLLNQLSRAAPPPVSAVQESSAFTVGTPITYPRDFFGRERQLRRLFALWQRPPLQNAAIIGPRRGGKTSLLLYLKSITTTPAAQLRPSQRHDWLPQPSRYRWVYVDFQDPRVGTQAGLLRYLLSGLNAPIPEPCNLDQFMDVVGRTLRMPAIILLDEIGVALQRCPELDDAFWEGLRSLTSHQVQGNLAFVLATHEAPSTLVRQTNHSSPFFNIFGYTATLGPFTETEARALLANVPQPFAEADISWILEQSGRWPLLLQILGRERLLALEESETDDAWRAEGLRQIAPFRHLLAV